ncbi:glycoside hydrolase family 47 protein [Durotheca rogersii]|uniref:glycoside hydrolase family 47 protein n=1 Tax=Durotheca rogersii TaxID=419775 RepID=UPI00221F6970|nr:glycoside hydrolase family 47 protein [Durotheca rogersii]KAI5861777.1 glycoside hydrolase family 47 protein [Durotheca rogersii]
MIVRRHSWVPLGTALLLFTVWHCFFSPDQPYTPGSGTLPTSYAGVPVTVNDEGYFWKTLPTHYPVRHLKPLPTGQPLPLPPVQAEFGPESKEDAATRQKRRAAVKAAFLRCWTSYKTRAFMRDELSPISGRSRDPFGGWGATLVDSLDTLWIMSLHEEFEVAATAATKINFESTTLSEVSAFETTIRYLGGFLSAYDLSGDRRLLRKAREVGDMLYKTFDTPNRMPISRWDFHKAAQGTKQVAPDRALIAEVGSLCVEFTRLSLATGDPRWFDATERIREVLEAQQDTTKLPGMWPIMVNPRDEVFDSDATFGLGTTADSTYEYLPKMYALLGGLIPAYQTMYEKSMATAIKLNLFRPMVPEVPDILIARTVRAAKSGGKVVLNFENSGEHLVCYAGSMLALGGKLCGNPEHLETARKLVDGCIWTYKAMPLGIMPETFDIAPCAPGTECEWDEAAWKRAVLERAGESDVTDTARADAIIKERGLPKGFTRISDGRYLLRPEAIESVFVLYRTTGRRDLPESAWAMFKAIQANTRTPLANAALVDVNVKRNPQQIDVMESFWMGETLKYFYLIFSEPDHISLDDWVFNTEAHPFRRLK